MAFKAVFLAIICVLAYSVDAEQNCSDVQCKLLPVGEDVASEFHSKASEKGVRIIYLNLKIGNETYHPLELKDEYLPERWVWAKTISEPMLSFPYDYDILSLGLLNYQVRSMRVRLEDQPSGCLASLNASCQDKVVARMLLQNVTKSRSGEISLQTDVVCVAFIEKSGIHFFDGNVNFYCCGNDNQRPEEICCEQRPKSNGWLSAFTAVLDVLTLVLIFYSPAFLLALPDSIFNLQEELNEDALQEQLNETRSGENTPREPPERSEYESLDQVYLNDGSPITCSTFLSKSIYSKYTKGMKLPFNIRLAFLWYFIIPLLFYIKLGLSLTIKNAFLEETFRKEDAFLVGRLFGFLFEVEKPSNLAFYITTLIVVPFVMILFLSPRDFLLETRNEFLSFCVICMKESTHALGKDILLHMLKCKEDVYEFAIWFIDCHSSGIAKTMECFTGPCVKQIKRPCKRLRRGCVAFMVLFCNILLVVFLVVILGVLYACAFLVVSFLCSLAYSPLFSIYLFLIRKFIIFCVVNIHGFMKESLDDHVGPLEESKRSNINILDLIPDDCPLCLEGVCLVCASMCIVLWLLIVIWLFLLVASSVSMACFLASLSCRFIVRMFGFLIMGLYLNAEIVTPFVSFFLAVTTNLYLCYRNLQKKYREVKKMIFKHWQKHKLPEPDGSINLSSGAGQDVIPEGLFWHVCGKDSKSRRKVMPILHEIYHMLRNMAMILIFLFLALCSVIFFRNTYNFSAVFSTFLVFVSGVIPGLFINGITKEKLLSGSQKHEMMLEIENAVKEYVEIQRNSGNAASSNRQEIELNEYEIV